MEIESAYSDLLGQPEFSTRSEQRVTLERVGLGGLVLM